MTIAIDLILKEKMTKLIFISHVRIVNNLNCVRNSVFHWPFESVRPSYFLTENVTFAKTENKYLTVGGDDCILRDSQGPNNLTEVTCLTAHTGTTGFSSGQHYWEVSMKSGNVEAKSSWWLGVTRAKNIPPQSDAVPTVCNGFWFLSFSSGQFHFSTEPQTVLPGPSRPETVGVYLDCDSGQLSFYNVEEQSLIGSFTVAAKHELYPLFNPGLGDRSAMKLIHRKHVPAVTNSEV